MYEFIEGTLVGIEPTYIVINNQGLGYKILTPNPFKWSSLSNQQTNVFVELVVREDAHTLYGFQTQDEKDLFNKLTTVKGIGPRTALSILAPGDQSGLIQAIQQENVSYLTNFPGVGKKTAQQIILDLQGKLDEVESSDSTTTTQTTADSRIPEILQQTKEALTGLGYSAREVSSIQKQLKEETFTDTQEALSYALKLLVK